MLSNVFEFWKQRSGEFRAGDRAADLGGQCLKSSTEAAVFTRVSLLMGGGQACQLGEPGPPLALVLSEFPALFKLSKYTLRVPASSAPVERNFSTSGLIMRPQRARLSAEMLEILVHLKRNFLEKSKNK